NATLCLIVISICLLTRSKFLVTGGRRLYRVLDACRPFNEPTTSCIRSRIGNMPNAVEVKKFHNNGNPSWQVSISALAVAVVALVVLAWLTGVDTSALIPALLRK